ncbi:MAG TPA: alanyl-tRNA editing protein [Candidatus Acidoferrales bacterium]|nr:alanyl-tRNA editing protein [Candidatus Acidoferrales bacterium]
MAEAANRAATDEPMTERLYYDDSFLREFDARVVACEADGARWRVRLDRTAFYPTSGGQPFDTGKLGDARVVEVLDDEAAGAEEVIHFTEQPVALGAIHGAIDWPRRFDHMQQHTAQHMLSAAFIELFQFQTVSFHLGREISSIDLAAPSIVPRHLDEAERRVNEIVFEDRAVAVRYGTQESLAAEGVRKKVEREGILRVIDIENFDRQPCGGTHLARTGQAGILLIRRCERQKQNWRVEFVAGFRALAAARGDLSTLRRAAESIGCGMPQVPEMIGKMQEERRILQRDAKKLTERLAELGAASLLATKAERSRDGARRVIVFVSDDATASYLAMLAAKLVANSGVQTILASRAANAAVFAQSAEIIGDMGALLRELLSPVGGKGGGSKSFAQGTVPDAAAIESVVSAARARLLN